MMQILLLHKSRASRCLCDFPFSAKKVSQSCQRKEIYCMFQSIDRCTITFYNLQVLPLTIQRYKL